jgi:hypothetical protein
VLATPGHVLYYGPWRIGVLLTVVIVSETSILINEWDRKRSGVPTVPRWRVLFGIAVIVAAIAGVLRIGGYLG